MNLLYSLNPKRQLFRTPEVELVDEYKKPAETMPAGQYLPFEIPIVSPYSQGLRSIDNPFGKRIFDVAFSAVVIVFILSWLIPLIAIIIKLDSKGPVFFKQLRSGKNNKPFVCLKFRSLKVNDLADTVQVKRDDNRFTSVGKFLRKTNLDEFPQFFNVLQGHMSVVGPRPHMLEHTVKFSQVIPEYMVRHLVKPGVTGWAQVNGYRGEIKEERQLKKRVEHDIAYLENWSMWFDVKIIVLTMVNMLWGDKNAF
jgi:putative colanic acid biosynthesis UDP-glucose lipid carrier transferase